MIKFLKPYLTITLIFLFWIICYGTSAQTKLRSVDSVRYSLICNNGDCFIKDSLKNISYNVSQDLIKTEKDTAGEYYLRGDDLDIYYYPSLLPLTSNPVKSFIINDSITGLFMTSFYELDRNGTTGKDYIFYLNHKNGNILETYFTRGLEKFYTRRESCYLYFILSDFNKDGAVELGIIKEDYRYSFDPADTTILKQHPAKWYGFGPEGYKEIKTVYTKTLPEQYIEITINDRKPNDFLMGIKFGPDWLTMKSRIVSKVINTLYFTPAHRKR